MREPDTTEFADRMEAKLVSTGFNITAASPGISRSNRVRISSVDMAD